MLKFLTVTIVSFLASVAVSITSETLDVRVVSEEGFGDSTNQYCFAMAEFQGSLYVGTLNAVNSRAGLTAFFFALPFRSNGAQIWRGDIVDTDANGDNVWEWTQVLSGGLGRRFNFGVRKFTVAGDFLYAVTANHLRGFELWRTSDGLNYERIIDRGFGNFRSTSGRGLTSFNGYLLVGVENRQSAAKLLARAIDATGDFAVGSDWIEVTTDGFGFAFNWWFSDFAEFNGFLYVGTLNVGGMQLYRSLNGLDWENIFVRGADENQEQISLDSAAMDLYVYDGRIYIGTQNFIQGSSLWASEDGINFEAIFMGGNGNSGNAYIWAMQEYFDRLYVGTFKLGGELSNEFDLFSSAAPGEEDFVVETDNAFNETDQYGTRAIELFQGKLMIGSATQSGFGNDGPIVYEASFRDPNFPF